MDGEGVPNVCDTIRMAAPVGSVLNCFRGPLRSLLKYQDRGAGAPSVPMVQLTLRSRGSSCTYGTANITEQGLLLYLYGTANITEQGLLLYLCNS